MTLCKVFSLVQTRMVRFAVTATEVGRLISHNVETSPGDTISTVQWGKVKGENTDEEESTV